MVPPDDLFDNWRKKAGEICRRLKCFPQDNSQGACSFLPRLQNFRAGIEKFLPPYSRLVQKDLQSFNPTMMQKCVPLGRRHS